MKQKIFENKSKKIISFRWTFFGLANGDRCISVEEALFLFQACHEDRFSLQHWGSFLAGREDASAPVTFDEIKFWLILRPSGQTCDANDVLKERKEIRSRKADSDVREMRRFTKVEVRKREEKEELRRGGRKREEKQFVVSCH